MLEGNLASQNLATLKGIEIDLIMDILLAGDKTELDEAVDAYNIITDSINATERRLGIGGAV